MSRFRVSLAGLLALLATVAAMGIVGHGTASGPQPHQVFEYEIDLAVPSPAGGTDLVTISLYAEEPADGARARVMADGRAAMLGRFPGAEVLEPAEVSAQFKLFDTPVRWPQRGASWLYNPEGATPAMPAESAFEAITLGAEGWNNAGGSGFHFDFLSTTTTTTGCDGNVKTYSRDGKNVVGWGHIVGNHLGFSCHYRSASLVQDTPFFAIEEIDVIFEPIFAYDFEKLRALALHEFGHALGLDHTEPILCPGKAMCAGSDAITFVEPQSDDVAGVVWLYGVAPPLPIVPPGPRPFRAIGPSVARD